LIGKDIMPKTARDKRKELNETERRQSISFTVTLKGIDNAEAELLTMIQDKEEKPCQARVGAIKVLLDSKYKKLNKLLPDLKAVEMTGAIDNVMVFQRPEWLK